MIFAEDPPELRRARDDIATGQLEQALEALKRIDAGRITRDFVRNDLRYYLAYCEGRLALTGGGDKTAAASAMLEFVKQNPNSYHFYEAAELLGDLAMATENPENALKYYAAIGRAPWPEYQLRAALLEAAALTALSRYAEALTRYESVLASTIDTPESLRQKLIAQSGKAVCLAENGRADEGIALLEEMIAKNDPGDADLFGRIYNALGRCQLKADRPQESLMAFPPYGPAVQQQSGDTCRSVVLPEQSSGRPSINPIGPRPPATCWSNAMPAVFGPNAVERGDTPDDRVHERTVWHGSQCFGVTSMYVLPMAERCHPTAGGTTRIHRPQ